MESASKTRRKSLATISFIATAMSLLLVGALAGLTQTERDQQAKAPEQASSSLPIPSPSYTLVNQPSPQALFDSALEDLMAAAESEGLGDNVAWNNMQWIQIEREDGILVRWEFNSSGRVTHYHFGDLSVRLHVPGNIKLGYDLKGYNEQSTSYTRWHGTVTNGAGQVIGAKWYPTGQVVGDYYQAWDAPNRNGLYTTASSSCVSACQLAFTQSSADCATTYSTCLGTALSNFNSCLSTAVPGSIAAGGTVVGGMGFVVFGPPGAAIGGIIGGIGGGIGGYIHCYNAHQGEITACQNTYGICLSGATSVFNLCLESCWTPPSGGGG